MAHFAKVLDGKVIQVMVAEQDFMDEFIDDSPGEWIQTSYNTYGGVHYDPETKQPSADQTKALRKNFAGRNYLYHKDLDAFSPPKPYDSWTLNETTCLWEAPVEIPSDFQTVMYEWNEEDQTWDTVDSE